MEDMQLINIQRELTGKAPIGGAKPVNIGYTFTTDTTALKIEVLKNNKPLILPKDAVIQVLYKTGTEELIRQKNNIEYNQESGLLIALVPEEIINFPDIIKTQIFFKSDVYRVSTPILMFRVQASI